MSSKSGTVLSRLEQTAYELTENIPVGTYTMIQPADGGMASFSFMSKRFLDLLGLDRATVEKDPIRGFDCVHPDDYDEWISMNVESFQHRKPFYGETRVVVNGQVRWVLAESIPRVLDDGSTVWEGALSDITARKVAEHSLREKEAALLRAKESAEDQERKKSNLLAHISHEIRTPLTSMIGIAELLDREGLNDNQRQLLSLLRQSGDTLLAILNTVLDHSKIEAGGVALSERPFNLNLILQKVFSLHNLLAEDRSLKLHLTALSKSDSELVGDPVRVEQVLMNLVSNAVKFTPNGTVHIVAQCKGLPNSDQCLVRLEVTDTGMGIDPSHIETLFVPFNQASSRRDVQRGTGLGLSICKALVELMGGTIGVQSSLGHGSKFWVEIPLRRPHSELATGNLEPQAPVPKPRLKGLKVLLVDDNPTVLLVVGKMLSAAGAIVIQNSCPQKALEHIQKHASTLDALVMDIQMPEISGLDLIRMVRREHDRDALPIVVLTAGLLNDERSEALNAGANDVLFKPVMANELISSLLRALSRTDGDEAYERVAQGRQDFPFLEGIHRETAIQSTSGSTALFFKLLRLFCSENQGLSGVLIDEVQRQAYGSALKRLHNLRGASQYIGALDVSENVLKLEELLEPFVRSRYPIPSSSPAYPVIGDIQQSISGLTRQVEHWEQSPFS